MFGLLKLKVALNLTNTTDPTELNLNDSKRPKLRLNIAPKQNMSWVGSGANYNYEKYKKTHWSLKYDDIQY